MGDRYWVWMSETYSKYFLIQSDDGYLIPAHIWTPWFSLLGSKSGFNSLDECFEDLTPHVFAVETGLSSDPAMNWRVSGLDHLTLVSNSDAHSPDKLGREANLFDTDISYQAIRSALKEGNPKQFLGTIEFYPEEGKYHLDGHRKCKVRFWPKKPKRTMESVRFVEKKSHKVCFTGLKNLQTDPRE